MSAAVKHTLRKPTAAGHSASARGSLRRVAVEPVSTPDADGEEALDRVMSSLAKAAVLAVALMIASAGSYIYIMQNQHKSFEELVEDLVSAPEPTLASQVAGCKAPVVSRLDVEMTFSADVPLALKQSAQNADAITQFVECIVAAAPQFACSAKRRSSLVADLKLHANVRETLAAEAEAARQLRPSARFDGALVEAIQRDMDTAVALATLEVSRAGAVASKVHQLVRAGLLGPSDFGPFGFGVPALLKAAVNSPAARSGCSG